MLKPSVTVALDAGVDVELKTTEYTHNNGDKLKLDAGDITLPDYFLLEDRIRRALGVLRERARKNTPMEPIYSTQITVVGENNDKANGIERTKTKSETKED